MSQKLVNYHLKQASMRHCIFYVKRALYHITSVNRPLQTSPLKFHSMMKILKNLAGIATQLIRKLKPTCSARIGKSRSTYMDLVTDRIIQRLELRSKMEWPCPGLDLALSLITDDFETLRRSLGLIRTHLLSPQYYTSHITLSYHSRVCDMRRGGSYQCHIYGLLHTIYHQISQCHRILGWSETMSHITHTVTIATTLVTIATTALDDTDTVTWSDWGQIETSSNWRFIKSKSSR